MGKVVGIVLVLGGIAGGLYQWIVTQNEEQKRIEEFCFFLHKTIFGMKSEKLRMIEHFEKYHNRDPGWQLVFQEISKRLKGNIYPNGVTVWESVLNETDWGLNDEIFEVMLKCGNGFFGKTKEENISFLKKQLEELEKLQKREREKNAKERNVWVPVGMLSGLMFVILFL